ncbi:hypothetical protein CPB83DRAFT_835574 [Crepidotus variabilis]|uniref:OTU domain-containing protein n=1 Tax=Crepidotus variabilis TaxID=179855 RepID=A0A9P6EHL0_9AGAR|nr:hypothetical protein CPB83DRAFT_835574 [Crepidotus variabilis]
MGKTHRNQKAAKGPAPQLRSRNTRSSKGRLLSDTSSSTTQLNSQLSLLGLYAAHTVGDGNCLFRALSDQLYGSPSKHQELRQQICDHIELHKARYEPFVEDDRGLDDHLRAMRENATYGGHMELSAFANMTKRNVKVIQPGLVYVIECEGGGSTSRSEGATSLLATTVAETDDASSSSSPRRSRRMSVKSPGGPEPSKNKTTTDDSKEEVKVKLGKGYFVYEEVTSDEEDARDSRAVEAMINVGGTSPDSNMEVSKPTVYVAYHDWEHFSSIRNLRGPHTGLPNVLEAPPPDALFQAGPEPGLSSKDREKERKKEWQRKEKERKERERERREKERKEKERASVTGLKVKLKVPPSLTSSSPSANASTTSLVLSGYTTPATLPPSSDTASESQFSQSSVQDPSQIPLPSSRSSSPFIHNTGSLHSPGIFSSSVPTQPSSLASEILVENQWSSAAPSNASTSSRLSSSPNPREHPRHPHAHVIPQTPRSHYRSPKRTYDESSASGGEDVGTDEERRRRRRVGSVGYSRSSWDDEKAKAKDADMLVNLGGEGNMEVDLHIDVEYVGDNDSAFGGLAGGTETPALSAPGSSTGSSSSSSPSSSASVSEVSASRCASVAPGADVLDDDKWDDDDEGDVTVVMDGASLSNSISSEHTVVEGIDTHIPTGGFVIPEGLGNNVKQKHMHTGNTGADKPLTRRQRKALGLPKLRKGQSVPTTGLSAGRIVIPGGKWRGRSSVDSGTAAVGVQQDGITEEEWRRNGTGRLDVRGFRELKI